MLHAQSKSQTHKPSGLSSEEKLAAIKLITRKLVVRDSGIAGLLLWIPVSLGSEEMSKKADAYTDGTTIFYCDSFFTMPLEHQLAVTIHEMLHIVLRHATRFKNIHQQQGDRFNSAIANICADAIVIRTIQQQPNIGPLKIVNPYVITAENIVSPEDIKKIPGKSWTMEMLYHYLQNKTEKAIRDFLYKNKDKIQEDIKVDSKPSNPHMDQVESRVWSERFKRAVAGSKPNSLLREVLKDLPISKTPWQKYFREFMVANVMPTTILDYGRPSRRTLASKGRLGYFEPGTQRDKGAKKAGIVIDTSGSIDDTLLQKFISETNSIMEQTGCEIVIICADAAVQSVDTFREPITNKYKAKGGGGTDFRPAIEELEKYDIDCCVYLTDMCGTFPNKAPSFPVMWASICEQKPPFGKLVYIDVHS